MLVLTNDPTCDLQRGEGFQVGQLVFLADRSSIVRATAKVREVSEGVAHLIDLNLVSEQEAFSASGTEIINAIAVTPASTSLRKVRSQQQQFRDAVLERCSFRCVLSDCNVPEALEAAHLPGRSWELGHNSAVDGIALRADLHRLLDTGIMTIDGTGRVQCTAEQYNWLNGKIIK